MSSRVRRIDDDAGAAGRVVMTRMKMRMVRMVRFKMGNPYRSFVSWGYWSRLGVNQCKILAGGRGINPGINLISTYHPGGQDTASTILHGEEQLQNRQSRMEWMLYLA